MPWRILLTLLAAPWILLAGAARLALRAAGLPRRLRAMASDSIRCPDGHANPLMQRWSCRCGAAYLGHAFGPCPICGAVAGWIRCERCGLAIRSPWKDR